MSSSFANEQDPFEILKQWVNEAKGNKSILRPDAMLLSTASMAAGFLVFRGLSSRVVLLKEITERHLIFYTNYKSQKSWQMFFNPCVALNLYWPILGKQIRLEGKVRKTSRVQSLQYWNSRPFESQISQYISKQSKVLENPSQLKQEWETVKEKFQMKGKIPCPAYWGGYIFTPYLIEFWVEKPYRLHERLQFKKKWRSFFGGKDKWISQFLYP